MCIVYHSLKQRDDKYDIAVSMGVFDWFDITFGIFRTYIKVNIDKFFQTSNCWAHVCLAFLHEN